jgi:hypothetical protein
MSQKEELFDPEAMVIQGNKQHVLNVMLPPAKYFERG